MAMYYRAHFLARSELATLRRSSSVTANRSSLSLLVGSSRTIQPSQIIIVPLAGENGWAAWPKVFTKHKVGPQKTPVCTLGAQKLSCK